MGVEKALEQWAKLAREAEGYRKNAFISIISKDLAQANIIPFPVQKKA